MGKGFFYLRDSGTSFVHYSFYERSSNYSSYKVVACLSRGFLSLLRSLISLTFPGEVSLPGDTEKTHFFGLPVFRDVPSSFCRKYQSVRYGLRQSFPCPSCRGVHLLDITYQCTHRQIKLSLVWFLPGEPPPQ